MIAFKGESKDMFKSHIGAVGSTEVWWELKSRRSWGMGGAVGRENTGGN